MKVQIVQNKYLNALLLLMLFSAIIHMIILAYLAISSENIYILNYFNILDIDAFIPNFLNSPTGNFFSFIFMAGAYYLILAENG